jgi:hypothetical protein
LKQHLGRLVLVTALVAVLPGVAQAQAQKGDKEILLFGNVTSIHTKEIETPFGSFGGGTNTFGNIFVNFGVYVTNALEVGGGPQFSISSSGGGEDGSGVSTTTGANGFLRLNFGGGAKVAPYVGAEVNVQDFKAPENGSVADNVFIAAIAGVKSYLSEKAALDMKGQFGFNASAPGDQQLFGFTIGLTFVF